MARSCLSIAGLDPSGGAGVLADAKTFQALGFHPACVVAAVTFQDTVRVRGVVALPSSYVVEQLRAVLEDLDVAAVKVGVLYSAENIAAVASELKARRAKHVVVDPVLRAKGGERLIEGGGVERLVDELLPLAEVATPNAEEAEELTGVKVGSGGVAEALERLRGMGVEVPVVKGVRVEGVVRDYVLYRGEVHHFERRPIGEARGGGCVFSSAIAALLAMGLDHLEAVRKAGDVAARSIERSLKVGRGYRASNPLADLQRDALRLRALEELKEALRTIEGSEELAALMPEVRMNVAVAIPGASELDDVCAVDGRITCVDGRLRTSGCPWYGASSHLARLLLEVMRRFPEVRAAMNVRYGRDVLEACRRLGLRGASFDRSREPPEVGGREGMTMSWGVREALKGAIEPPDVIYDEGGWGKEAMVRVLGRSAREVVEKAKLIARELRRDKA
ncbi:bifunctional hydroxymethylpyrimidine kinase/phosphomethylpyrimidine kinase [Candidatus Geothermarchaeota archaeon ex4572_27]|nr:MAG: bifunctional hydroxymethylpyrimidine kinase/phosphomethylpyrimidine kinase [Candidatus Geothermarchaeota archaeon ex4572_27]